MIAVFLTLREYKILRGSRPFTPESKEATGVSTYVFLNVDKFYLGELPFPEEEERKGKVIRGSGKQES